MFLLAEIMYFITFRLYYFICSELDCTLLNQVILC